MKVRSGFVSNSSSSSFLIFGVTLGDDSLREALRKVNGSVAEADRISDDDIDGMDSYELADQLFAENRELEYHQPEYSDVYVGGSWDGVRDDETGKQFKERVLKALQSCGLDVDIDDLSTHAESWYNG